MSGNMSPAHIILIIGNYFLRYLSGNKIINKNIGSNKKQTKA